MLGWAVSRKMEAVRDELNVSCLASHRKLDKHVRRQVRRVTSVLAQVVSPVIARKKFRDDSDSATTSVAVASVVAATAGESPPEGGLSSGAGVVIMDPSSTAERIVQCVVKQQENRMLSPVGDAGFPDADSGAEYCSRGSYRYCSPKNFPHTTILIPNVDAVEQDGVFGGKKVRGGGAKHRVRSVSMSVICNEPNCSFADDCHTAPLMCLHHDHNTSPGGLSKGVHRRNPLRHIGSLFGCFVGMRRDGHGERKSSWERSSRALALLDLSQRQQDALAMKQDTIELLQWKLEQLQLLSSTGREYAPVADFPELQSVPQGNISGALNSKRYTEDDDGKLWQDRVMSNSHADDPQLPPSKVHSVKLENAELSAILHLFDVTAVKARMAVRYFCKVFMKQMEVSGYSVWRTLAEIEPNTKFLQKEHTAFILESRLNKALYHSFENDSFDETGLTRIIDPEKRCVVRFRDFQRLKTVDVNNAVNAQHEDFDHDFWSFSEAKLREMWFLFPWNVVFKDSDERTFFTAAFLDAAKCVWLLHRLAYSVHPHVNILRVGKGMHANSLYVEQVTPIDDGCKKCDGPKVEFMSMPGFQVRKKIIKCQVYRHLQCR